MINDRQIIERLARHINKHGCAAFADDDEGDVEYERAIVLLDWFGGAIERLGLPVPDPAEEPDRG